MSESLALMTNGVPRIQKNLDRRKMQLLSIVILLPAVSNAKPVILK